MAIGSNWADVWSAVWASVWWEDLPTYSPPTEHTGSPIQMLPSTRHIYCDMGQNVRDV